MERLSRNHLLNWTGAGLHKLEEMWRLVNSYKSGVKHCQDHEMVYVNKHVQRMETMKQSGPWSGPSEKLNLAEKKVLWLHMKLKPQGYQAQNQ